MSNIFISYSRRDSEIVNHIMRQIEDAGMSVWIDREDIKAGKTWRVQIVEAIATCDAFVLMLSSNSAASDNVRREIDLALDAGRAIFIIKLDPVKLPAEMLYQLVGLQHIELQQLGFDKGVHRLIDTLKEHLATWKPHDDRTVRQVELVFQEGARAEFGAKKREQTLDLISALTETPQSQLDIADLAAGGVHVFVDMPAAAAFELKTRALNQDPRLKQFGVKSLRLVGDKQFVNISLGILTATATIGTLNMLWMNLPSLFPSLFGVAVGKVIVITTVVAVTTAAGIALADGVGQGLSPALPTASATHTPEHNSPPPFSQEATAVFTSTPAKISTPTFPPGPTIAPPDMPLPMGSITASPSPTKYSPISTSTLIPSATPSWMTASTTLLSKPNKIAQIVSVECGSGLALKVHIRISNEAGISSYSVWSTWGGGGQIDRTFSTPLPKDIDEVIVHEHLLPDPVDRQHEVGLRVTTSDNAQPIYTYAFEPGGRCPDHYQPSTATTAPSLTPTPLAQIVGVECGPGLTSYVHFRITSLSGISSYSVWSTWGGGGDIDQTFSAPLPTVIDQVVEHTHAILDPVDRLHQIGLKVTTPDNPEPFFAYALEPDGRCPGHYEVPTPVTILPTETPPPPVGFQVTGVFLQADPPDYVGSCPVRITFSGTISVDSAGTVAYKFLRSDGASAPTQTLTFDGPGSQNVSDTWDLGGSGMTYSGWEQIQVLDPQALTSREAAFNIQCS